MARVAGEQRGEDEVDEQPGAARGRRGARAAHSSMPAASLALCSASVAASPGVRCDAAEAEAQHATRVVREAGEPTTAAAAAMTTPAAAAQTQRWPAMPHGWRVRCVCGWRAQRALRSVGARPVSARVRCSRPSSVAARGPSLCGMRTSRSQRCLARCRSARTLALVRGPQCGGGQELARASGRGAGCRLSSRACARASAAGVAGSVQTMWVAASSTGLGRWPSRRRSRRPRGRGRRARRRAARGAAPASVVRARRGGGGDQPQPRRELDERLARAAASSATCWASSASECARGLPGEHGQAGAPRVRLGEQHRRVRCRAPLGGARQSASVDVPAPPARPQTATSGPPGSSNASPQAAAASLRPGAGAGRGRLGLRLPIGSPPSRSRVRVTVAR